MNMMDGFFFFSFLLVIVGAREGEKEKKRGEVF